MKFFTNVWMFLIMTTLVCSSSAKADCESYPAVEPSPPFAVASRITLLEQQDATVAAQYLLNEDFKLASTLTISLPKPNEKDFRYVVKAPYFGGRPNHFEAKVKDDRLIFTAGVLGRGGQRTIGYFVVDVPEEFHKIICHRSGAL